MAVCQEPTVTCGSVLILVARRPKWGLAPQSHWDEGACPHFGKRDRHVSVSLRYTALEPVPVFLALPKSRCSRRPIRALLGAHKWVKRLNGLLTTATDGGTKQ